MLRILEQVPVLPPPAGMEEPLEVRVRVCVPAVRGRDIPLLTINAVPVEAPSTNRVSDADAHFVSEDAEALTCSVPVTGAA